MADRPPVLLKPDPIDLDHPDFEVICGWPFKDDYVRRLLREDFPQRALFGNGQIWVYREPDGRIGGFGTLDESPEYPDYTSGRSHLYIPLLAVRPDRQGMGYGTFIVQHLIGEAALLARGPSRSHDVLFLDVYIDNAAGINIYQKCGFDIISLEPVPDPGEGGRPFLVMSKRVSIATR